MHQGPINPNKSARAIPGPSPASNNGSNGSLPFSEDAEKGVLSSLLSQPGMVAPKCLRLKPQAFYVPTHMILYETILEWPKPTEQVDFIWLKKTLGDWGQLDEAGGPEFLSGLYDFVLTAQNVEYYVDIVLDKYARRLCWIDCEKKKAAALDPTSGADAWDPDGKYLGPAFIVGYPAFESIDSLLNEQIEDPREIVAGLLHQASKAAIGAGSKSYKTWILPIWR